MKAPFPWFGGKRRVAAEVWRRLGPDVAHYVEPFFGSGAVLLERPGWTPGDRRVETVNDADGMVANFWRALAADPDAVADAADWPVNEADLHARHLWLVGRREALTDRLMADPEWYDVRAAGWWVWGACAWIGSGWCSGDGPWRAVDGVLVKAGTGDGVSRRLPHISDAGQGINRRLPHVGNAGRGINRQGSTVREALAEVAERLRWVRVACGDWSRICTPTTVVRATGSIQPSAVFLDPPYDEGVGYTGGGGVAADVWAWALENGGNPLLRIAVCGYDDGRHVPAGWTTHEWKATGGYALTETALTNATRERIWFSPHCLTTAYQPSLFEACA